MPQSVIKIHPAFWQAVREERSTHMSPMERMVVLLKQENPDLCDHDAMELIAHAHREEAWDGPHLVVSNNVPEV